MNLDTILMLVIAAVCVYEAIFVSYDHKKLLKHLYRKYIKRARRRRKPRLTVIEGKRDAQ